MAISEEPILPADLLKHSPNSEDDLNGGVLGTELAKSQTHEELRL
jgi:hypothetical protein